MFLSGGSSVGGENSNVFVQGLMIILLVLEGNVGNFRENMI